MNPPPRAARPQGAAARRVRQLSRATRALRGPCACVVLLLATAGGAAAQRTGPPPPSGPQNSSAAPPPSAIRHFDRARWRDRAGHRQGYVASGGARIHYLDWGGKGPALVLVPGAGASAHIFDELGPALRDGYRVVAVTPRGQGQSSTPDSGYTVAQEAEDVRVVLDHLRITEATLVGHSIGGATIVRFAQEHPGRVDALIFLDGTLDYAGLAQQTAADPFPRPPATGSEAAIRDWWARCVYGFWTESTQADFMAAPRDTANYYLRPDLIQRLIADATAHPKDYRLLRMPMLAFWPQRTVATQYPWLPAADSARAAQFIESSLMPWEGAAVDRFRREAPQARVETFPGGHYFFLGPGARRTAVVIREFLGAVYDATR